MSDNNSNGTTAIMQPARETAISSMAGRYKMSQQKLMDTLKNGILRGASDSDFAAFMVVADQYDLNPFTKEIHAFSGQGKGITPMVGIDGWATLVNRQPGYDGCEFEFGDDDKGNLLSATCRMYLKNRARPVAVTEFYAECKRPTQPWQGMPRRMLRHKAFMQCARLAFGFSGIYDEDEARDVAANGRVYLSTATTDLTNLPDRAGGIDAPDDDEIEGEIIERDPPPAKPATRGKLPPHDDATSDGTAHLAGRDDPLADVLAAGEAAGYTGDETRRWLEMHLEGAEFAELPAPHQANLVKKLAAGGYAAEFAGFGIVDAKAPDAAGDHAPAEPQPVSVDEFHERLNAGLGAAGLDEPARKVLVGKIKLGGLDVASSKRAAGLNRAAVLAALDNGTLDLDTGKINATA